MCPCSIPGECKNPEDNVIARLVWPPTIDIYKNVGMAWTIDHENILNINRLISGFDW